MDRSPNYFPMPLTKFYCTEKYLKYLCDMSFKLNFRYRCQSPGLHTAVKIDVEFITIRDGEKTYSVTFWVHYSLKRSFFQNWFNTIMEGWNSFKDLDYIKEVLP